MQRKDKSRVEGELKKIDKYKYNSQDIIGSGASSTVFLGKHITTGDKVAIKVIDKLTFGTQYNIKHIQSEIDIMKKMSHPNILQLLDVYQTTHNMYIVTEYCDQDLNKWLKRKQRANESKAARFLRDMLRGLEYLVAHEITHRDLKPANILLKNGVCKISDFGFAKNLDEGEETILKSVVGTPLYMSPQILSQIKYTTKSDLWSIGLIYYQLLHGYTPWPAKDQMQLLTNIMNKTIVYGNWVSDKSRHFIDGCLKINQSERMSWKQAFEHPLITGICDQKQNKQNTNTSNTSITSGYNKSHSNIKYSRVNSPSQPKYVLQKRTPKTPTKSPLKQILDKQQLTPSMKDRRPNISCRYKNGFTPNAMPSRYRNN